MRVKTVTLGDWLCAVYYYFNVVTRSFDPFFYRPDFIYNLERLKISVNLERDEKPKVLGDILKYIRIVIEQVLESED